MLSRARVLPASALARCGDGFKDYITQPKPNGYRSLHSRAVVDGGGGGSVGGGGGGGRRRVGREVQVRTMEMHRTAEYGRPPIGYIRAARHADGRPTSCGCQN